MPSGLRTANGGRDPGAAAPGQTGNTSARGNHPGCQEWRETAPTVVRPPGSERLFTAARWGCNARHDRRGRDGRRRGASAFVRSPRPALSNGRSAKFADSADKGLHDLWGVRPAGGNWESVGRRHGQPVDSLTFLDRLFPIPFPRILRLPVAMIYLLTVKRWVDGCRNEPAIADMTRRLGGSKILRLVGWVSPDFPGGGIHGCPWGRAEIRWLFLSVGRQSKSRESRPAIFLEEACGELPKGSLPVDRLLSRRTKSGTSLTSVNRKIFLEFPRESGALPRRRDCGVAIPGRSAQMAACHRRDPGALSPQAAASRFSEPR